MSEFFLGEVVDESKKSSQLQDLIVKGTLGETIVEKYPSWPQYPWPKSLRSDLESQEKKYFESKQEVFEKKLNKAKQDIATQEKYLKSTDQAIRKIGENNLRIFQEDITKFQKSILLIKSCPGLRRSFPNFETKYGAFFITIVIKFKQLLDQFPTLFRIFSTDKTRIDCNSSINFQQIYTFVCINPYHLPLDF